MNEKIILEFPEADIKVTASVLETDLTEDMLKRLPLRCAIYHTLSTGCFWIGKSRQPKEPLSIGSQSRPICNDEFMVCKLDNNDIIYTGLDFWGNYGENTEPLASPGPIIAKVDPEYIEDWIKAGKFIWNAQQITHKLVTVNISRKEG